MLAACLATAVLFDAPLAPHNPWLARAYMGLGMGLTAVAIIKSPWGKASGAHFNPAITLAFYRLGKIGPYDACFYIASHFVGGLAGVLLAAVLLGPRIASPHVDYAVTIPGSGGPAAAFIAEAFMAALLMGVVLYTSNRPRLAPWTTWLVGLLIANYILFLAPVSGFSINPARTLSSAIPARVFTGLWIYFTAPLLGMLMAAEAYLRLSRPRAAPAGVRHYFSHRHLVQRNRQ
jgi:aquaporin Z